MRIGMGQIGQTPATVTSAPSIPGPVTNPTTKLYVELAAAGALVIFAPGGYKLLAAIPLLMAVGGSWSL